ncbi:hypothetical protein Mesau_02684 [Mesorhizobium australicum WSM2073]|uniref:Uncharacterized protein n=3 Tax=Mesorhizobium TaxID=68287 RepID=L0KJA8_MESAW|nr:MULTISPECIES: hypothetical protein [Mesorhizobium]ADV11702.1 hypothetical protein Mesci_2563 [Mesorhizobium ciceri biovar biserrulae WSM1271]AEH87207.1 hypothetical protein Mesop_2743 [Mesorhizobium opportunistum WSM2075]AGB45101.1 hypothetical protein Mesau_02684 [Mesorhizobium australicum WSM2073]OBP89545.1 hypothetical protein BAE40_19455 [Mesorhizobium loti]
MTKGIPDSNFSFSAVAPTVALFGLLLASGCAVVDTVSSRANTFNQQASEAKSNSILTNVVRAAYAEPLQFTELQSTQGTAQVNGSITTGVPFPFRGGTGTLPLQTITGSFLAGTSAANTFAVANLSSQEFYQGIQKPIPQQLILAYLSEGYDARILLNIFTSGIEITQNGKTTLVANDPNSSDDWQEYYSVINILAKYKLEGEKVSDTTPVGIDTSRSVAGSAQVQAAQIAQPGGAPGYEADGSRVRLVKHDAGYRFCFRKHAPEIPLRGLGITVKLSPGDYCGASSKEIAMKKSGDKVRLRTRSLEGAILYLGALVRNEWGIGNAYDIPHTSGPSYTVFKLGKGYSVANLVNVWYKGQGYGIARDPAGNIDGSSRVLQLLTDIQNLQSSSKDLPTQNVYTLLGG